MSKKESNKKKSIKWHVLIYLGIVIVTIGIPSLFYMNKEMGINHILFFNIFLLVLAVTIIFMISSNSKLYFDNIMADENLLAFFLIYTISILISSLFSYLPTMSWTFIPIAIVFLYFSNPIIALASTYCCLFVVTFISGTSYVIQILYMLSILCTVLVFSKVKKIKNYFLAMIISLSLHLALTFSYNILFLEGPLEKDIILYCIFNFVINVITTIFAISIVDLFVVRKYNSIYTLINDQEFVLMKQLKENKEKTYFHAIHCAYFCDKISPKLGLDNALVKAGTYYKNIAILEEGNQLDNINKIALTHKFPKPVIALLEELYTHELRGNFSKEACLILITDEIISMIERILTKNKDAKFDIEELIEAIALDLFKRKEFKNSSFTFREFEITIAFFKEEKLYYDFLRR